MADINLMPSEGRSSESLNKVQKNLTIFSVAVLVIVAVFTIATLIFFTSEKAEQTKQAKRIEAAAAQVNSYQSSEELLTVIGKKADLADKALSSRLIYTDILNKIATLMPQNVYFGDIKIDGNTVSTSAKAKTSADVAGLVASFVSSDEGKKLFSSVTIDSLASVPDADTKQLIYSFSVSMQLVGPQAVSQTGGKTSSN